VPGRKRSCLAFSRAGQATDTVEMADIIESQNLVVWPESGPPQNRKVAADRAGRHMVECLLEDAGMSAVNNCEVIGKLFAIPMELHIAVEIVAVNGSRDRFI